MKTRIYTPFVRIISMTQKGVSRNGAPSYYVTFETFLGERLQGCTAPDAYCEYNCDNFEKKEFVWIEYQYTNTMKISITVIQGTSEESKKAFREYTKHSICRDAKRNILLNCLFSDIIKKMKSYDEDYEFFVDLRAHKKHFKNEIDYKYAQKGNLAYPSDVRNKFEKFGYNTQQLDNAKIWEMYLYAVRDVINFVLKNEIYII